MGKRFPESWVNERYGIPPEEDGDAMLGLAPTVPAAPDGTPVGGPETEPDTETDDEDEFAEKTPGTHPDWIRDFTEGAGREHEELVAKAVREANPQIRDAVDAYLEAIEGSGVLETGSLGGLGPKAGLSYSRRDPGEASIHGLAPGHNTCPAALVEDGMEAERRD